MGYRSAVFQLCMEQRCARRAEAFISSYLREDEDAERRLVLAVVGLVGSLWRDAVAHERTLPPRAHHIPVDGLPASRKRQTAPTRTAPHAIHRLTRPHLVRAPHAEHTTPNLAHSKPPSISEVPKGRARLVIGVRGPTRSGGGARSRRMRRRVEGAEGGGVGPRVWKGPA